MAARTKMAFKDGRAFVFSSAGQVWYQDQAGEALWEASWGDWSYHVAYSSSGRNFVVSYNQASGKVQIHLLEEGSHTVTYDGQTDKGFTTNRLAYCGAIPFLMQSGSGPAQVVKMSSKYEVVSRGEGDATAVLQGYLNSGTADLSEEVVSGGSGAASSSTTSSTTQAAVPASRPRPGGTVRYPEGYTFAYTGDRKVTYSNAAGVLWEAQWDKEYSHHQAFVFGEGNFMFSYKQSDSTVTVTHLQDKQGVETLRVTWPSDWTAFKSKSHQGIQYLVATKPGKVEIAALEKDSLKLVYSTSTSESDPETLFATFIKTLVVGEKVVSLKFDDESYFTYTNSGKVTYNSSQKKHWEDDWGDEWGCYMGFGMDGKNYLLLTDGGRGMCIKHLTESGATDVSRGQWEHDYTGYCMSRFGSKSYLVAKKADGHNVLLLGVPGKGYEIVWNTATTESNVAFEEYVRTLIGKEATVSFSKTASAYESYEHLRYPNGYVFGYLPAKPGEVCYDSPEGNRLWKLSWTEDYTHHVGFMIFGKNYLLSYIRGTGAAHTRLLSGTDATLSGTGALDKEFELLRVAYFDEQPYLIAEAPGRQAIYKLSPNDQTLLHSSAGAEASQSAEAVIKSVAAQHELVCLPNGYLVDFAEDAASCINPTGHLWDAKWDSAAWPKHVGIVNDGHGYILSPKPEQSTFRLDRLEDSGLKPVLEGDLGESFPSWTPVYYNAKAFLIGKNPENQVIFSLSPAGPEPEGVADPSLDADPAFENFILSLENAPKQYSFIAEKEIGEGDSQVSVTDICYPQGKVLQLHPDKSAAYGPWKAAFDQDTTHSVGFVFKGKNYVLNFKHGQGTTQILELGADKPTETHKTNIDPEWLHLSTFHTADNAFLIADKKDVRSVYLLTATGVKEIHSEASPGTTEPVKNPSTPNTFLLEPSEDVTAMINDVAVALAALPPNATIIPTQLNVVRGAGKPKPDAGSGAGAGPAGAGKAPAGSGAGPAGAGKAPAGSGPAQAAPAQAGPAGAGKGPAGSGPAQAAPSQAGPTSASAPEAPVEEEPALPVQKVDPSKCKVNTPFTINEVGKPVDIDIQLKDEAGNPVDAATQAPNFKVVVETPTGTLTPEVLPKDGDNDALTASFTPTTTGPVKVSVVFNPDAASPAVAGKSGPAAGKPAGASPTGAGKSGPAGEAGPVGSPLELFSVPPNVTVKPKKAGPGSSGVGPDGKPDNKGNKKPEDNKPDSPVKEFPPKNPLLHVKDKDGDTISLVPNPQSPFTVTLDLQLEDAKGVLVTGLPEDIKLRVTDPEGNEIPNIGKFSPLDAAVKVSYQPKVEGDHRVDLLDPKSGTPIATFNSAVEDSNSPSDSSPTSDLVAFGPGVNSDPSGETPVEGLPTFFTISPKEPVPGSAPLNPKDVYVKVEDPSNPKEKIPVDIKSGGPDGVLVHYTPKHPGDVKVHVAVGGSPIPGSPFPAEVAPKNLSVTLQGPGLEDGQVGSPSPFLVTVLSGDQPVKVAPSTVHATVTSPEGKIPVTLSPDPAAKGVFKANFTPKVPGDHQLDVAVAGKPQATHKVKVHPGPDPNNTVVVGLKPSLGGEEPAKFKIVPKDKEGNPTRGGQKFEVTVQGKKHAITPTLTPNADGSTDVDWVPKEPGKYVVKVKAGPDHVADSPYLVVVEGPVEPHISPVHVVQLMNVTVTVHAMAGSGIKKESGGDNVEVHVTDPVHQVERPAQVTDRNDGTYQVSFSGEPGEYTINALINGVPARDCPFVFKIPEFEKKFAVNERFSKVRKALGL